MALAVHQKATLTTLLLRDGTIYFSVLLALNVAGAVLYTTDIFRDFSLIFHTISTILLSRFFLNLRDAVLVPSMPSHPSQICSDLEFSGVLGNIGGSLAFNEAETDDEAMEDSDNEGELGRKHQRATDQSEPDEGIFGESSLDFVRSRSPRGDVDSLLSNSVILYVETLVPDTLP
ncbi:uncharacterized protein B0H18DRAFT_1117435 [Fomitopsis serialis]|uniref:uncharacterized protein n=1 Tax=Fomitopsis serialis TaxID=139415 RepID=UPI0020079131|nr:uncharacterized protein B0H18DRAFT_1117435 [Neoantrodia serialis]KAH9929396.1 hypothetical protein B0H18DRAFT_1117435 [Neoantrodia serialis]